MPALDWRPMRAHDIGGVIDVARASFPDHFEARACFEERLALFPQGCLVLAQAEAVKGYVIAYPWPKGAIPPLNSLLGQLPDARDSFYLHDLALHPDVRGQGHASPAVEQVARELRAAGGHEFALVSVNGTKGFWRSMGFDPVAASADIQRKLESYGEGAAYMIRKL
ncbi:acetyltransferase, GNAT family [Novosphingobium sp. Rr 2-17]|uniref:GNAT family N-acetyltransferase n=1 Tax=Novosphingobium sp. Rr 2-17 TaxID=555793 RepID=UPI000269AB0A|nr:GNAT family N-acetyltransferase [Novosphingobium sp. Rr 2-17]EIZ80169.1 acetyltransferase, GNAT family [Novosphingobium sp. Rr 2-17]